MQHPDVKRNGRYIAVPFDNSPSMHEDLDQRQTWFKALLDALDKLVESLKEAADADLYSIGFYSLNGLVDPGWQKVLAMPLPSTNPAFQPQSYDSPICDQLLNATSMLEWIRQEAQKGDQKIRIRRMLMAVTDGFDNASTASESDVAEEVTKLYKSEEHVKALALHPGVEDFFKACGFRAKDIFNPANMNPKEVRAALEAWSQSVGEVVDDNVQVPD